MASHGYQTRSSRLAGDPEPEGDPAKDYESDEDEEAGLAPDDTE